MAVLGDEPVDDAEECGEVVCWELGDGGEAVAPRASWAAWRGRQALAACDEIIICGSLIDALTFWCAGFRHVTASFGAGGFTADYERAFREHQVRRVLIAYDRDDPGALDSIPDPAVPCSDPLEQQAPPALIAVLLEGLPALSLPLLPLCRHLPRSDEIHPGCRRPARRALRDRHHPHRHGGNCVPPKALRPPASPAECAVLSRSHPPGAALRGQIPRTNRGLTIKRPDRLYWRSGL